MKTVITFLLLSISTFLSAQGLVINEFVASNDSTSMISDELGEYDDWVELFNNDATAIDMSGYYFSDDIAEPDKWRFPNGVSIPANGYLMVWTDSDDEQGDLHTSFKLSKGGEALILSDSFLTVVDSLTFGEQETNVAMARIPNGTGDFTSRAPTFDANNESLATTLPIRNDFLIYPNPVQDYLQLDFSQTNSSFAAGNAVVRINDVTGKTVFIQRLDLLSSAITLDIRGLAKGMHVVNIQTQEEVFVKKIMIEKHD